jgi:tetratricopeptide (TPR) repeat protein
MASAAEQALARGESAYADGESRAALRHFRRALELDAEFELAQEWIDTVLQEQPDLRGGGGGGGKGPVGAPVTASAAAHERQRRWWQRHGRLIVALSFALELGVAAAGIVQQALDESGEPGAGMDHFAVLSLGRDATTEEVHRAFRERSRQTHPDKCAPDVSRPLVD